MLNKYSQNIEGEIAAIARYLVININILPYISGRCPSPKFLPNSH